MKRFIIFFFILIILGGIYNFSIIRDSFYGYLGDKFYQNTDFQSAKKQYTDILENHPSNTLLPADIFYNLGNTLYRLGEKEKDTTRMQFWKKSIESYTKSLSLRTDKETEENLAFVKEKLQKEEQELSQKKREEEQQKKEETGDESGEQKSSEQTETRTGTGGEDKKSSNESGTGRGKSQTQSGQNWANQGSYNPVGGGQNTDFLNTPLSDTDRQEIQNYMDTLKKFAKQNGRLLNPERGGDIGSIPEQIRNFFGNDSFFQEIIPMYDGKKDW